jgi:hypothetical protein
MKQKKAPYLLTLSAVCTMLSCSAQTVRRLRKKGLDNQGSRRHLPRRISHGRLAIPSLPDGSRKSFPGQPNDVMPRVNLSLTERRMARLESVASEMNETHQGILKILIDSVYLNWCPNGAKLAPERHQKCTKRCQIPHLSAHLPLWERIIRIIIHYHYQRTLPLKQGKILIKMSGAKSGKRNAPTFEP